MSSRQVLLQSVVRRGGLWFALGVVVGALAGCGDGGGTAAAAGTTSPTTQTITQSDIVLPSSVQVVTAK